MLSSVVADSDRMKMKILRFFHTQSHLLLFTMIWGMRGMRILILFRHYRILGKDWLKSFPFLKSMTYKTVYLC